MFHYCIILCTCPYEGNYSHLISEQLVKEKLVACVSITNNINSIYTWHNKLETSSEKLLIIKTKFSLFEPIKDAILKLHPYDCPEIIAIPIIAAESNYLNWINNATN